jgi:hypothetical protein
VSALYRAEGTLFPEASRTHLEFRLFLDRDFPALEVHFAYKPKLLEDPALIAPLAAGARAKFGLVDAPEPATLQNLLTLSFDDGAGFRGAAHRHLNDQTLVVGGPFPSPGLTPGPVPAGVFRITLSAHAVLTPTCTYRLTIRALETL